MRFIDEYRSPDILRGLLDRIGDIPRPMTLMEVCGTHTMAISRSGLRPLLAPAVDLLSGPGCPVCVTSERDMGKAVAIAGIPGVVLATFGDMMRVPGAGGTLLEAASRGAAVKVVYSPLDALALAEREKDRKVVFLGVGFETTAPSVAASLLRARERGVENFYVLSLHKLVPPALRALVEMEGFGVEGFILPGHVSSIIGAGAYSFLADEYGIPGVVAGFEPADILQAIYALLGSREGKPSVDVAYSRAVKAGGNPRAIDILYRVFEPADAEWRGLSFMPASGLGIREEFREHDAGAWEVEVPEPEEDGKCRCGDILCGLIKPPQCPMFAAVCTPDNPLGPCMVSSEGTCASYYLYDARGGRGSWLRG
ncbi:MAG: hydrogenase formation protein HypD [Actinomycetota bacterium]|nr:hydrogenase formation protein HypD [Actinomycetota bacterium]